jgi:hypothetical protein
VSEEELVISTGLESGEGTYTRVVSTHVPICDGMTVDYLLSDHILSGLRCLVLVDPTSQLCEIHGVLLSLPFRLNPMIVVNETILTLSIGQSLCMSGGQLRPQAILRELTP